MNKEQFYELLGEIDDNAVNAAQTPASGRIKRKLIATVAAVAACICVLAGAGIWYHNTKALLPDATIENESSTGIGEVAIAEENIEIYYIKDGAIASASVYLQCDPQTIFDSWREYNSIGDEVELISVRIDDNGTEFTDSSGDSMVAGYTVGDTFTLTVTVTENIKNYYDTVGEEKLLESLKLTLIGYSDIDFDEYILILE